MNLLKRFLKLLTTPFAAFKAPAVTCGYEDISVGSGHLLALKKDGSLCSWGHNKFGQLGDGTTIDREKPMKILDGVRQVSAGKEYTMAILNDGSLWAWGNNKYGQLGDGTTTDRHSPVKILDGVKQVSAGHFHTMAIMNDGSLWAWGWNEFGQLGDGTHTDRHRPVKILDDVQQVSAGAVHTMAIRNDGALAGWGIYDFDPDNRYDDYSCVCPTRPEKIFDDVRQVSAGKQYTMAILSDGSLWAWGCDEFGQLGYGTRIGYSKRPIKILDGVRQVSAGNRFTLAILNDGSLWGWGCLSEREKIYRCSPVKVYADKGVRKAVAGGGDNSLWLVEDGTLRGINWKEGVKVAAGVDISIWRMANDTLQTTGKWNEGDD